jgi:hypothetical protein
LALIGLFRAISKGRREENSYKGRKNEQETYMHDFGISQKKKFSI